MGNKKKKKKKKKKEKSKILKKSQNARKGLHAIK
jgi:hypothetical protein